LSYCSGRIQFENEGIIIALGCFGGKQTGAVGIKNNHGPAVLGSDHISDKLILFTAQKGRVFKVISILAIGESGGAYGRDEGKRKEA